MKTTATRIYFGKQLKILRKKNGFSQEELGFRAGLHRTYIGSVERGEQNISIDNIEKLAEALRISPKEFFE